MSPQPLPRLVAGLVWLAGCAAGAPLAPQGAGAPAPDLDPEPTETPAEAGVGELQLLNDDEPGPTPAEAEQGSVAACAAAEGTPVALAGPHALGGFTARVTTQGAVEVRHTAEGNRAIFATASGAPVEFARTELHIEEHQGSFEAEPNIVQRCQRSRLYAAETVPGGVILRGGFEDADARCAALSFSLRLCERQPGHLGFTLASDDPDFDQTVLRVASDRDERIHGMGMQAPHDTLDLKGRAIEVLAQEGGIGRGHLPITPTVNLASPGSGGHEGSTYYAAAHYLTSRARSVMLEDTQYAVFDFSRDTVTRLELFAPEMHGRILQGATPLQLIERFTEYAGRMPELPDWVHDGAIVALATDGEQALQRVDALRSRGAEIAAVWNQTWSGVSRTFVGEQVLWNWIQNPQSRPGWDAHVAELQARGIRMLCYVNSMFRDVSDQQPAPRRNLFREGVDGDYFVRREDGSVYMLPITAFEVGLLDLSNPEARRWMKDILKQELLDGAGCSGWMADFAEALPFDAALASGESPRGYHNQYPVEWAKLNREALEESGRLGDVLVFNRSGHTRSPAHATLLWQGDQLTTWDKYDGLVSALRGLISGGFSGISLNHSDVGGYTSLTRYGLGYKREAELLKRWTEMNAFTTVLRTHEGNLPGDNPQVYSDDDAMAHFARFTRVYRALGFYRRQLVREASQRGWPVVRHLMLHYPEDERAARTDDQFLLGSEILVAPIKNKCWSRFWCRYNKRVYLPAGRWVHLWSGQVYGSTSGGREVRVRALIGEPAVFYREGSEVGATFVDNLRAAGIEVAR